MPRQLHDHWFKEAKREGWRSRAYYKLKAIDEKRRLIRAGDAVLDCGCAPGSWLQYAEAIVGDDGVVVGIDLQEIPPLPSGQVRRIVGDLREIEDDRILAVAEPRRIEAFDVMLSDMAPNTTGHRDTDHLRSLDLCNLVLDRGTTLLREGGHLVMKVFEGSGYPELVERTKAMFEVVRPMRPPASRNVSREMFIVGMKRKGGVKPGTNEPVAGGPPPVPDAWSN
ncbi:MAG: 23S rRNA (uridine(2552)-2'-O)-methyltransferase [Phycisphaerae bacterium]|nr:23S rRNA (uridine(2552)-2'-O)-methyltransferase [Phycisphaerae bacterium]